MPKSGRRKVRLGYEIMWLSGMALAPNQIAATDFTSGQAVVDTSAEVFCQALPAPGNDVVSGRGRGGRSSGAAGAEPCAGRLKGRPGA